MLRLEKRRLGDWRGSSFVVRQAAELLFARRGPEHPNAGVRVFRVVGKERKLGIEHNVEELERIEGPLGHVVPEAFRIISGLLRRPARLGPQGRFKPVPEYPEFSWKEAVLNAVAHRDYGVFGRGVEVWLFDDRMEVTSPGTLLPEVSLEQLLAMERVHVSRNPRLVRCLVDLGYMRDQGEGIPRMFYEMQAQFLPKPTLDIRENEVRVVLQNTPELSSEDRLFVEKLGKWELDENEFRALLETYRDGQIDNGKMRQVTGMDTLSASSVLRKLRDRKLLVLHAAGAASYYTLSPHIGLDRGESVADRGELAVDQGELTVQERELIENLGKRPRTEKLRAVILILARRRAWTPSELAAVLGRPNVRKLAENHLSPMHEEGLLKRTIPERPTDPNQAYYATEQSLGPLFKDEDKS